MTSIFYITDSGKQLAEKISTALQDSQIFQLQQSLVKSAFENSKNLVFISATGIAVRVMADLIRNKHTDPAVVVLDDKGLNVVSLLSGHLGGANTLAKQIAHILNTNAVITTASDVHGLPSLDMFAFENNLFIDNDSLLPQVMKNFVQNGALRVYIDSPFIQKKISLPDEFLLVGDSKYAEIIISHRLNIPVCGCRVKNQIYLRPKNIVIGIGCNSNTSNAEIESVVSQALAQNNLSIHSIVAIATIDLKTNEQGIINFADSIGADLLGYTADELNSVYLTAFRACENAVYKATGAYAVAEPAALIASGSHELLFKKYKSGNVTVSAALLECDYPRQGRLFVVGIGPGNLQHITPSALSALKKSDYIVGYSTYIEQISRLIKDKQIVQTGMTEEKDRCAKAIQLAEQGKIVSLISGGDPGIYGMAGLVYELAEGKKINIQIIPGISAVNACAAIVGAPIMHDFAVISLSDRLTSWDLIEKRLRHASEADFIIALYNPRSMGRQEHLCIALNIIAKYRPAHTPVAIVKSAMRENQAIIITDLSNANNYDVDMQSTVIIGNSQSKIVDGKMVTPRGYKTNP